MKKLSLILVGIFVLSVILIGCGPKKVVNTNNTTNTTQPVNQLNNELNKNVPVKTLSGDELDLKNIKVGDKVGELTVSQVNLENRNNEYVGYIKFSGEVTIEGQYEKMKSPVNPTDIIRMSLGEDSKSKVPARVIKEDNKSYVYLPYSNEFGNKGTAKLVINEFQVEVGGEEGWPNYANISKVIELNKEN